jgi:hypothetical protein
MRRSAVAVAVATVALAACGPSLKPAMKAATDQLAAEPRAQPRDVGTEQRLAPLKWSVGQWTLTRNVNDKGEVSFVRTAVVGKEGGGYWIEMETQDWYRHGITKILYAGMPTNADAALDSVRKIVVRTDDKPDQVMDFTKDDPSLAFAKLFAKQYMKVGVAAVPDQASREDAKVPAGTFHGCAKFTSKIELGPFSSDATTWFHPAVPLSGGVKAAASDGKWTMELVDYGLTGATSRM